MSMGPGIVGPGSYPIRDLKSRPERVGRVRNPAGKFEIGKMRNVRSSDFEVEKPTRVNATVRTADKDVS